MTHPLIDKVSTSITEALTETAAMLPTGRVVVSDDVSRAATEAVLDDQLRGALYLETQCARRGEMTGPNSAESWRNVAAWIQNRKAEVCQ